jgi:ribosome-associated toxin RatA of RatAB toxin-antitoxin module
MWVAPLGTVVDELEVSTVVYLPPAEVYEFLLDFPGYADYSSYLRKVRQVGDGTVDTEYHISVAWWKLSYTARTKVTGVDPPTRIDWEVVKDLRAHGYWAIEEVPDEAPPDRETASRVRLVIEFDPESAHAGMLDLPRLVSLDWVVKKVTPLVQDEAEKVVERIVADLEGERRSVELTVRDVPRDR